MQLNCLSFSKDQHHLSMAKCETMGKWRVAPKLKMEIFNYIKQKPIESNASPLI